MLEFSNVIHRDKNFAIKGKFEGTLRYNNDIVATSNSPQEFIITMNNQGEVLEKNLISGTNHLVSASKNSNSEFYAINNQSEEIVINEVCENRLSWWHRSGGKSIRLW